MEHPRLTQLRTGGTMHGSSGSEISPDSDDDDAIEIVYTSERGDSSDDAVEDGEPVTPETKSRKKRDKGRRKRRSLTTPLNKSARRLQQYVDSDYETSSTAVDLSTSSVSSSLSLTEVSYEGSDEEEKATLIESRKKERRRRRKEYKYELKELKQELAPAEYKQYKKKKNEERRDRHVERKAQHKQRRYLRKEARAEELRLRKEERKEEKAKKKEDKMELKEIKTERKVREKEISPEEKKELKRQEKERKREQEEQRRERRRARRRAAKERKRMRKLQRKPKLGRVVEKSDKSYELVCDMLLGIRYSVSRFTAKALSTADAQPAEFTRSYSNFFPAMPGPGHSTPGHSQRDFTFRDYAPLAFRRIREYFKTNSTDYLMSLTAEYLLSELVSPGKSGQFFYFSYDLRFMLKTVTKSEAKFFRRILPAYYDHVMDNPDTLIVRFYGLHRVKPYRGQAHYFVVMENVFQEELHILYRFDMKGSRVGRETPEAKKSKANVVLKDNDFINMAQSIKLGPEKRRVFKNQLIADVAFLDRMGIMDYSLLLGIHDMDHAKKMKRRSSMLQIKIPGESYGGNPLATPGESNLSGVDRLSYTAGNSETYSDVSMFTSSSEYESPLSLFQKDQGGVRATDELDRPLRVLYFMGIIDILQPYNFRKRGEHYARTLAGQDPKLQSSVHPRLYGIRFKDFMLEQVETVEVPEDEREQVLKDAKLLRKREDDLRRILSDEEGSSSSKRIGTRAGHRSQLSQRSASGENGVGASEPTLDESVDAAPLAEASIQSPLSGKKSVGRKAKLRRKKKLPVQGESSGAGLSGEKSEGKRRKKSKEEAKKESFRLEESSSELTSPRRRRNRLHDEVALYDEDLFTPHDGNPDEDTSSTEDSKLVSRSSSPIAKEDESDDGPDPLVTEMGRGDASTATRLSSSLSELPPKGNAGVPPSVFPDSTEAEECANEPSSLSVDAEPVPSKRPKGKTKKAGRRKTAKLSTNDPDKPKVKKKMKTKANGSEPDVSLVV